MNIDFWTLCLVVGLVVIVGTVGAALLWAITKVLSKMLEDEISARLDDVPGLLVALALRRLPRELREYYRPEWEGDLLAAFTAQNKRYPLWKLISSFAFVAPLFVSARGIRRQTKLAQKQGAADERLERLRHIRGIGVNGEFLYDVEEVVSELRGDGQTIYRSVRRVPAPDSGYDIELETEEGREIYHIFYT
ncbi:hypothetical protein H7K45_27825 [Mycobacterium yunnanensis]|uniref:Uncharacterized protein n=1 Tax=Mycobacterium yunnanensis TaxID=368477 RepID=A0A9X2Z748_9MYCO|nr:hypothetical protein [Mycobacterium yunnanensis]MCV7424360.1 hypothetical protein [Mycobacterium yunnanensis]